MVVLCAFVCVRAVLQGCVSFFDWVIGSVTQADGLFLYCSGFMLIIPPFWKMCWIFQATKWQQTDVEMFNMASV